jgi:hypothetical protein
MCGLTGPGRLGRLDSMCGLGGPGRLGRLDSMCGLGGPGRLGRLDSMCGLGGPGRIGRLDSMCRIEGPGRLVRLNSLFGFREEEIQTRLLEGLAQINTKTCVTTLFLILCNTLGIGSQEILLVLHEEWAVLTPLKRRSIL